MENSKALWWVLGAVVLVLLVGVFMLSLGGQPAQPTLSTGDYLKLGNDLYAQGRFADAAKQYEQAVRVDSANVSARVNLGNAYFALDRLDDAATAFKEGLDRSPNDADIYSNLAAVLLRQNKVDEALAKAIKARDLNSDLAEAHYILGAIYRQKGDNQNALAEFQTTLQLTKDARLKAEAEANIAQLQK